MNCETLRQSMNVTPRVTRVSDLGPAAAEHVAACAACAAACDERIHLDQLLELTRSPAVRVPEDFAARTLRAALASERASSAWWRRRSVLAAAAALVVALAGGTLWRIHDSAAAPPEPELLSHIDLLMDWELLTEDGETLDVLREAEIAEAVDAFEATSLGEDGK